MQKRGFTLAEVLITLAIIGIVAALTIPTLVQNFQSRAWETASEVFQRRVEESLKVMNAQGTLAGYTTTEDFVNELRKHMKINKICTNSNIDSCFESEINWGAEQTTVEIKKIKYSKHFGQRDWNTDIVGLLFENGVNALLAYNPNCRQDPFSNQINGLDCVAMLYDTTAFKLPNSSGKDIRSINVSKLGSECAFTVNGTCYGNVFEVTPITKAECEANKEKWGINYCFYDNDAWAGAVKACGGTQNMPTMAQLAEVLSEIYHQEIPTDDTGYIYDLNYDVEKAAEYGFPAMYGNYGSFNIWSGEQMRSQDYSYFFDIRGDKVGVMAANRTLGWADHAICLE